MFSISLLYLFDNTELLVRLIFAFCTASAHRKIALEQARAVRAPTAEPWGRLTLPQVRDLTMSVPELMGEAVSGIVFLFAYASTLTAFPSQTNAPPPF